ncbi:hypothetical protein DSL72_002146 [Monilinia vaccinii-corymbosi]|uniref:Uncharacterized protein n=1 Tax=Monilinia vaccinii-corymbosi TaxID=61207 RepID=A0A8A3PBX9_9HELO|nr:hypothetical protein DSL72_002146 [Monilinia vaccinii-corymbosi]
MSTPYGDLVSIEELNFLMDELEAERTIAATVAVSISVPVASSKSTGPVTGSSSTTTTAPTSPTAHISNKPSISAMNLKTVPAQKIAVRITDREQDQEDHTLEKEPDRPLKLNPAYFDDDSLANCAVLLSFNDTGVTGAASSRAAGAARALSSTLTKPVSHP